MEMDGIVGSLKLVWPKMWCCHTDCGTLSDQRVAWICVALRGCFHAFHPTLSGEGKVHLVSEWASSP